MQAHSVINETNIFWHKACSEQNVLGENYNSKRQNDGKSPEIIKD